MDPHETRIPTQAEIDAYKKMIEAEKAKQTYSKPSVVGGLPNGTDKP